MENKLLSKIFKGVGLLVCAVILVVMVFVFAGEFTNLGKAQESERATLEYSQSFYR